MVSYVDLLTTDTVKEELPNRVAAKFLLSSRNRKYLWASCTARTFVAKQENRITEGQFVKNHMR